MAVEKINNVISINDIKFNQNTSDHYIENLVAKVKQAQTEYKNFTQEQVDKIVLAAAIAVNHARIVLAKEAVKETGMGIVEDKVIKNHFAAEYIYNKFRNEKTCGEIASDPINGIHKIAESIGVIVGIIPVTNPTSTTIFKALLALKTRNGIIFSPNRRAEKCIIHTAQIMLDAAVKAGAPPNIIGWIKTGATRETVKKLMSCDNVALILATGGPGLVKAAYSSGKPAIGVGAGNTPAVIDETADIAMAVSSILLSKTFDNGTICASEQSVIAVDAIYDALKKEFLRQGAYILTAEEGKKVGAIILQDDNINTTAGQSSCSKLNADTVGQSAYKIAQLAGIKVSKTAKVLIAEVTAIGPTEPFSYEKLSPTLALYHATDFNDAVDKARQLVEFGGLGHTAALYTDEKNLDRIKYYGNIINVGRILINTPSSQGAIGDIYNFRLAPSLTLGTGIYGGNIVSENITTKHLLNIKIIAERRENPLAFCVPAKIFFKRGCLQEALQDSQIQERKKAFIVTDSNLFTLGYTKNITDILERMGIKYDMFNNLQSSPDLSVITQGCDRLKIFQPDLIIAIGGGSVLDAAKVMSLMYEQPETQFKDVAMRFLDISKRIVRITPAKKKALFVAIPTTSGTGSEVTPFAVVTDDKDNIKYPLADYSLTPDIAIVDPNLVMDMPKELTATSGVDAMTHALEAVAAITANEYTMPMALEALELLFEYLPRAYHQGAQDPVAREKVHYAATMAGMAFANAFLGICHSMTHKLSAAFHLSHGIANAILIPHVIRFNATEAPWKQGIFPQYRTPESIERYAHIATMMNFEGTTLKEKVASLIEHLQKLLQEIGMPKSIKETGIAEEAFLAQVDELAELAFDDQCTGTNPRYPLIEEIRQLYLDAYYGKS